MENINHKDVGRECILCKCQIEYPHECDDPKCPGNVNRKIIEMFPGLIADIEYLSSCLCHTCDFGTEIECQRDCVCRDNIMNIRKHITIARALQEASK